MPAGRWTAWRRRIRRAAIAAAALASAAFAISLSCIRAPLEAARRYPAGVILRDSDGAILRVGLGPNDQDCRPYYSASTNDWVVLALIASEDKRFWHHPGIDPLSILRATGQNVFSRRRISGASTITSQAVRLITPHPRTWRWKYIEAFQALRLEMAMTKTEILSQYLNRAPMGSNLVGIEAGAMGWFGKSAKALSLGEAALLIGMVQSPTRFRPDRSMDRALKRRGYVLDRMLARGMITKEQRQGAESAPIALRRSPRPFDEPFFADWAQSTLKQASGDFTTTLDRTIQRSLETHLKRHAREIDCSAAGVVIETATGAVRALSCSDDYFSGDDGQVNTALAPRPAGSTLKPFVMAAALDMGIVTPGQTLLDVPRHFSDGYSPVNFDSSFRGRVSAADALVLSLNIPFIDLVAKIGITRFHATLHALGLSTISRDAHTHGAGIATGNADVRLLDLANAYAAIARGGVYTLPQALESRTPAPPGTPIFSPAACWIVSDILSGQARSQAALGHIADTRLPRAAWKTGTSSANRDAWTVAWNPEYVVAIWCGHKQGHFGDAQIVGAAAAAPIAWSVMRDLHPASSNPWYAKPDDIIERPCCTASGQPASTLCPATAPAAAIRGKSSTAPCTIHRMAPDGSIAEFWPDTTAKDTAKSQNPIITSPADNAVFRIVPGIPDQAVTARAGKVASTETLWWFLNAKPVGTTRGDGMLILSPPPKGLHRLTCSTADGRSASISFTVK